MNMDGGNDMAGRHGRRLGAAVGLLLLAGCAGREPVLAPTVEASDSRLSCRQIDAEVAEAEGRVAALAAEKSGKTGRNVAVGAVTALLFWPALFLADLGEAERAEMANWRQRIVHLNSLKAGRGCR
jgi:hypothetical protein